MKRFLLHLCLAIGLASCAAPSPGLLTPTQLALPTCAADPALTPSTQAVITPTILSVYPLSAGASWIYSVTLDYAEDTQIRHWTGTITETYHLKNRGECGL